MALSKAPILAFADPTKKFILVTDASDTAISYILMQEGEDKILHPLWYAGRILLRNERNYNVMEREMLAIIAGIRHWHYYLANNHFIILTDHCSLKYIQTLKQSTGKLARWAIFLMGYSFDVKPIEGKLNTIADVFSRRPYPETEAEDVDKFFEDLILAIGDVFENQTNK